MPESSPTGRLAGAGHGGAVVLTGEPGAGKTTVAEAVAHLASAAGNTVAGATVAWGRCPEAASTPAFWPWSQVLRALPDGPRVQTARQRLDGDAPGSGEESVRQFRVYEAVSAALGEAAASDPVLAVVDDLHAADEASLGLLRLLAGDLHRMPVLCLFTVRDTESSAPASTAAVPTAACWPAWPGVSAGPTRPPGTPGPAWPWTPASAPRWGSQGEPGRDGHQSRAAGDQRAQRAGDRRRHDRGDEHDRIFLREGDRGPRSVQAGDELRKKTDTGGGEREQRRSGRPGQRVRG
jgi:hypothetical protein